MTMPSPLYLSTEAQRLARNAPEAEAAMFNRIALCCMVTVALGSALQVIGPLLKDLRPGRHLPPAPSHAHLAGSDRSRSR